MMASRHSASSTSARSIKRAASLFALLAVPGCASPGVDASDEQSGAATRTQAPSPRDEWVAGWNEDIDRAFANRGGVEAIVSRLKYGDRPELAGFCARLMRPAGLELWADKPVLVPVPLYRWRQFERRYNQSTELARALGRLTGLAVDTGLVARTRPTRQQVGLSADARQRNVSGAFTAHPDALRRLKGRGVVLVDDVITTGSTVKAITRELKRAGVAKIDVISFARVVTGAELPI